jgi:hypothetical protein
MTKHFHFKVGDPVRIVCQGLDVAGTVHSSYNDFGELGHKLAGVEMYSYRGNYHYWKAGDGGKVYRKVGTEWLEVWPQFEDADECLTVFPHFKVFLTDETNMWSDQVVSRLPEGCKLMGAYLVDVSREVHTCSLTPSFEAWWLYTVAICERPISDNVADIIAECDAGQEPVRYFSTKVNWAHDYGQRNDCHWIVGETGLSDSRHVWYSDNDEFESYDDLIEHMLEEAHANHPV